MENCVFEIHFQILLAFKRFVFVCSGFFGDEREDFIIPIN